MNVETVLASVQARWYAAYTAPRHEKRVSQHLETRSIENYLPVYSSSREWKQRRAVVQLPLFPSYIFIRILACDRMRVLEVPGVLNIIGFNGQLTAIPDAEVQSMRAALEIRKSQPHPFLAVGRRVTIRTGALAGLHGVVVGHTQGMRLVVSIDSIMRSFSVELDSSDFEPLGSQFQEDAQRD